MQRTIRIGRAALIAFSLMTSTGCSVADVDWVVNGVIAEVDWLLGIQHEAPQDASAPAHASAGEFALFLPATHDARRWQVQDQSGTTCFLAHHNRDANLSLDKLTGVSITDLLARYGGLAEGDGFRLVEEGTDAGQPFRIYEKGATSLQFKVGHGRGNYTMKVAYNRNHCRG